MAKALNLKIKDDIYKLLQTATEERGCTKTHIVEQALQAYLSDNVDNATSNVESATFNVDSQLHKENSIQQDVDNATFNVDSQLHKENSIQQDVEVSTSLEKRISAIEQKLEGIDFSDLFTAAHTIEHGKAIAQKNRSEIASLSSAIDEVQGDILTIKREKINQQQLDERLASAIEPLWESLDYMGDRVDQHDQHDQTLLDRAKQGGLNQEALAKRLGTSGRGLANHRNDPDDLKAWTSDRDPDGIGWEYRNKKYYPIIG